MVVFNVSIVYIWRQQKQLLDRIGWIPVSRRYIGTMAGFISCVYVGVGMRFVSYGNWRFHRVVRSRTPSVKISWMKQNERKLWIQKFGFCFLFHILLTVEGIRRRFDMSSLDHVLYPLEIWNVFMSMFEFVLCWIKKKNSSLMVSLCYSTLLNSFKYIFVVGKQIMKIWRIF